MNPDTQAARDRLHAALNAWDHHHYHPDIDTLTTVYGPDNAYHPVHVNDLRLVLAALDQHEAHLEAVRRDIRQAAAEAGFAPRTEPVEITYTARPRSIDPGMGILGPSVRERANAYLANRREQHPQTSDQSTPKDTP